jgi:NAD(P)H-dependent flavin oxidoreductase YrpB (nitropropane dioxygenase family)
MTATEPFRADSSSAPGAEPPRNTHPALRTRFCELVGVDYPIVQTGMGWVSGARLTAATSAAGGLGILASATMTFAELENAIAEVKERTPRPFGVNLRSDQPDVLDRVALMIREGVRVASFAQAPGKELIERLKDAGVFTMPTIGARRHAEKVAEWGVDGVIAQGHEGGGHTGEVPTSLLLPQVCDAVKIPVLGAGGFNDGRGLVAALAYGASGIAMGTRFLLTRESTVPEAVKQQYLKTAVNGTVVTRSIDGHPQRVIKTPLISRLEKSSPFTRFPRAAYNALSFLKLTGTSVGDLFREGLAMKKNQELTWSQLAMAANAPMLTKAAMVDGKVEVGILPTGQVVGVIEELPTVAELIQRIVREAEETLTRLSRPAAIAARQGSPA